MGSIERNGTEVTPRVHELLAANTADTTAADTKAEPPPPP